MEIGVGIMIGTTTGITGITTGITIGTMDGGGNGRDLHWQADKWESSPKPKNCDLCDYKTAEAPNFFFFKTMGIRNKTTVKFNKD